MNKCLDFEVLKIILNKAGLIKISAVGHSMRPVIKDGDILTISKEANYTQGDIIVFLYDDKQIIAHRIIQNMHDKFYCKGDNSFRIEYIDSSKVLGKVSQITHSGHCFIPKMYDNYFFSLSIKINKMYSAYGYDTEKLKSSMLYKEFFDRYLTEVEKG